MFSHLSHNKACVPSPRGEEGTLIDIETQRYALKNTQESVISAVNWNRLVHFPGKSKNLGDIYRRMLRNHLQIYHAALPCRLAFLFGLLLLLLLAHLPVTVADDNTASINLRSGLVPRNIQFSNLSVSDGLSQAAVNSIAQDQHGFMWFGTQEGLNRYDGYEFTTYHHDPADPGSLSHDWIWIVFADNSGQLWIGTDGGGLSRYEPDSNSFTHFRHNPEDPASLSSDRVRAIHEDQEGMLWIGTDGGGLNRFNPDSRSFVHYRRDTQVQDSLPNDKVVAIIEDSEGEMWIGTDGGGLSRFDRKRKKFIHFQHDPARSDSLSDNRIRDLYQDSKGRFWVGTYSGGVNLFNPVDGSFKRFQQDPRDPYSLSHDEVRDVFEDADGTVWFATDAGLDEWRPGIQGFFHYAHDPADVSSIASDRVITLFQGHGGVLWVGTYSGISRWNFISDAFTYYQSQPDGKPGLSSNLVSAISESADGLIWIGTYGGGLNRLNPISGDVVNFRHDPADKNTLSDDRVMTVFVDKTGSIWAGTRSTGLNRLNPLTGKFTHYRHDAEDANSLSADGVTSIHGEEDGTLWVGTYGGGLNRFDLVSEKFTAFRHDPNDSSTLSSDRVLSIYRDRSETLWLGTEDGGLNEFDAVTQTFKHYRHDPDRASSLSSDTAWEILEDRDGLLWIATRDGGLNRWLPADRKAGRAVFSHYGKREGLLSNTLHSILEAENGILWLSSNRGLSNFNPVNGNIRHFDKMNGLQGDEFNFGAKLRSTNGSLLFGGTDGLVLFNPGQVRSNPHHPQVAVTAFTHMTPMARSHSTDSQPAAVTVGYRDYSINFEFTALDYTSPDKNQYRYMLDGFDQDWRDSGRFRRATYTNLPAGDYTFKVKASNNDGVWSERSAAIALRVTPPPWKSNWAYTGYFVLLLGLVAALVRTQNNKLKQEAAQRHELEKQVQLRTQELAERNQELEQITGQLEKASVTDPLTGLHNRRYLHQYIESEIAALDRYSEDQQQQDESSHTPDISPNLSFIMIDLDCFKPINDTYGHHAGDVALLQVRDILQRCCRKSDTIVRWGGDEFLIVGRHASRMGAEKYIERIRTELANHQFQLGGGHVARLSGSIGLTMFPFAPHKPQQLSWEQVATIADQAAYLAKENGRNAWVALYGTRKITSDDMYERLNTDLQGLVQQGMVEITTSLEKPLVLTNRVLQKNA